MHATGDPSEETPRAGETGPNASALPDRILLFARFPESGQAKTRLIPAVGAERAARLQAALTRRALHVTDQLRRQRPCDVEVRFSGGDAARMRALYGVEHFFVEQQGDGLGERLERAIAAAFQRGVKRALAIGTDCPEIEPEILDEAFASLREADVVLGPALDGGYYLIGLRAPRPELFHGIDWGTEKVLRQTLERAARSGCRVRQLRTLSDVDRPADLIACRRVPGAFLDEFPAPRRGRLSVVIPTLDEAGTLAQTLASLTGVNDLEVLVADGGSTDATCEIARRLDAQVVTVPKGRGRQMNAGAALASGEVLLFLHADTTLPENFQEHVWSTLDRGAVAGAFALRIRDDRAGLRWIEWGVNLRSRYLQMPYGDQGIFLRSADFYRSGGFPNWPLMEDYELCRRLRRQGRILLAPASVQTSPRRWRKLGLCRTTLRNQLCVAAFRLGVPPERLARWYASAGDSTT